MFAERFSQDPLVTYFDKEHPSGPYLSMTLIMTIFIPTQNVCKPLATDDVRDENVKFETDVNYISVRKNPLKTNSCFF